MKHMFRLIQLLCVAVLLVSAPWPAGARVRPAAAPASAAPLSYVGSLGGRLGGAYADGTLAYLIEGAQLTILDISDPAAPLARSRTPLMSPADRVVAAGGFVYLASSRSSLLRVYDARDPAAPLQVYQSQLGQTEWPVSLSVASGLLWAPVGQKLLYFDLQNPARPALLGSLPGPVAGFQVDGPLVYLLNPLEGLQVWDLTDLRSPALRAKAVPLDPAERYFYRGLALSGGTLYVAAVRDLDELETSFVLTFDVRDPAKPALQATAVASAKELSLANGRLVTLVDGRLLLYDMANPNRPALLAAPAVSFECYQVVGSLIYGLAPDEWSIADMSDPVAPVARGEYRVNSGTIWADQLTHAGSRLYVRTLNSLQIVDVSDPASPTLQGAVPTDLYAQGYQIDGARLLVPSSAGLKLVDASDPLSPTTRFTFRLGRSGRIAGDLAYVLTRTSFQVQDISDPGQPVQLASVPLATPAPWWGERVLVGGGRAYVVTPHEVECGPVCSEMWLSVWALDVSDPRQPRVGGSIDVKIGVPYPDVALSGTTLLVAAYKLLLIDARAIDTPRLSEAPYEGSANTVRVVGGRAYLTGSAGLTTLDLADPLNPALVSRFRLGASGVQVIGERAYVRGQGLHLLGIRSPATPLPLAVYPVAAEDFAVVDSYIYLSLGDGGLRIVQIHPERFPPPLWLPLVRIKDFGESPRPD